MGMLTGVVTDADTGKPIQGVNVAIAGLSALTDSKGSYTINNITPGTYPVTFAKAGYQGLTL